jgi:hypothetical protein
MIKFLIQMSEMNSFLSTLKMDSSIFLDFSLKISGRKFS